MNEPQHPTTAQREVALAREWIRRGRTIREAAVYGVDGSRCFTCEFAPDPREHQDRYDELERMLRELANG